jgi:hypothetical protein
MGSLPTTGLALIILAMLHMNAGGARYVITAILTLALFLTAGVRLQ